MNERKNLLIVLGEWWEQCQSQSHPTQPDELTSRSRRFLRWLMPNAGTLVLVALLLCAYHAWAAPSIAPQADAAVSGVNTGLLSYQGYLTDAGDTPLDGEVGITFRLYSVPTGGTALWTEAHTGGNAVPVSEGLLNVMLGSLTPIPSSVWSNDMLYLGVQVGDDAEMMPREVVGNVPTALTVPDGAITQEQAPFAPAVYHQEHGGSIATVIEPIIYTGWFHGSDEGYATYDLSSIFSQIDAVIVTKTRLSSGNDKQVTFMVTDVAGTGTPTPAGIKIWAYN